jgi:hypothetical protein
MSTLNNRVMSALNNHRSAVVASSAFEMTKGLLTHYY